MENKIKEDQSLAIAAALGGISMTIVFFFLIFAKDQAWVLIPIIASISTMGIFLGFFSSRK